MKIHSSKSFKRSLQVDSKNRLLLQQTALPDVSGNYTVYVNGHGCVYVQLRDPQPTAPHCGQLQPVMNHSCVCLFFVLSFFGTFILSLILLFLLQCFILLGFLFHSLFTPSFLHVWCSCVSLTVRRELFVLSLFSPILHSEA
ncbi:unnamed protein product [Eretmochelys imbricata]